MAEITIGEYFIPEGCTVKRVGNTIVVYKKAPRGLPPNEVRCRDCIHFGKGHTIRPWYFTDVCFDKPKKKDGKIEYYFSTTATSKVCEHFVKKEK